MVFQKPVLSVPGRLEENGSRIIPLCLPLHRDPGEMVHPMGYAQRSLPIALQLMPPESLKVKAWIPVLPREKRWVAQRGRADWKRGWTLLGHESFLPLGLGTEKGA